MTNSFDEVQSVLSKMSGMKPQSISFGTRLRYDLHLSDLQMIELNQWVEDTFGVEVTDDGRETLHRVSDLLAVINRAR